MHDPTLVGGGARATQKEKDISRRQCNGLGKGGAFAGLDDEGLFARG